jgi:hypothetical protein
MSVFVVKLFNDAVRKSNEGVSIYDAVHPPHYQCDLNQFNHGSLRLLVIVT